MIIYQYLFFRGIIVLEVRGFAAASSAALVVVLCYSTLETQIQKENKALDLAAYVLLFPKLFPIVVIYS